MIVIDSSALAKYVLKESGWRSVEKLLHRDVYTLDLALKEVLNVIWKHTLLLETFPMDVAMEKKDVLMMLAEDVLNIEDEYRYLGRAFEISLEVDATIYDSLFIAQASEKGLLVTCDRVQAGKAEKYGVEVELI